MENNDYPWLYEGAMCKMRNGGKFELWKIINDKWIGYNHKTPSPAYRYLNGKSPFSKEWDIIGPWSESLKFIFPSPRLFKDVFSYIAGNSDGTWYLYEFLPYINKETKKFNVKKGNIAPIEFIQMPTFPSNQWIETLHLADRIADIWVPIKGESLQ